MAKKFTKSYPLAGGLYPQGDLYLVRASDVCVDDAETKTSVPLLDHINSILENNNTLLKESVLTISKTYSSVAEMNIDASNVEEGVLVLIASEISDEDNGKLFVKNSESFKELADLSGAQGVSGLDGKAALVCYNTVTINTDNSVEIVDETTEATGVGGGSGSGGGGRGGRNTKVSRTFLSSAFSRLPEKGEKFFVVSSDTKSLYIATVTSITVGSNATYVSFSVDLTTAVSLQGEKGDSGKSLYFEDLTEAQKEELRGKDLTYASLSSEERLAIEYRIKEEIQDSIIEEAEDKYAESIKAQIKNIDIEIPTIQVEQNGYNVEIGVYNGGILQGEKQVIDLRQVIPTTGDTGDVLTKTGNALGNYAWKPASASGSGDGVTIEQLKQILNYKKIGFSSFTFDDGNKSKVMLIGEPIYSVEVKWETTKEAERESIAYYNNTSFEDAATLNKKGSYKFNLDESIFSGNHAFKVKVTETKEGMDVLNNKVNSAVSEAIYLKFLPYVYYGNASKAPENEAEIKALSNKELKNARGGTFSFPASSTAVYNIIAIAKNYKIEKEGTVILEEKNLSDNNINCAQYEGQEITGTHSFKEKSATFRGGFHKTTSVYNEDTKVITYTPISVTHSIGGYTTTIEYDVYSSDNALTGISQEVTIS